MKRNVLPFLLAQAGIHPLVYGVPGGGKSAVGLAAAKKLGVPYIRVDLSCRSEIEVQGAAVPDQVPPHIWSGGVRHEMSLPDEKCLLWVRPEWAYLASREPCLVVFEELLSCSQGVHAAALQTLSERTVGGLPLHPDTMVVAIANYSWCAANAHEVAAPLANRLCHLDWDDNDCEDWLTGLTTAGKFPIPSVPVLERDAEYEEILCEVGPLLAAAYKQLPSLRISEEQAKKANLSKGWPSHRSVWNAAQAMAACRRVRAGRDMEQLAVAGLIGPDACGELYHFLDNADLPDPKELIDWCYKSYAGEHVGKFPLGKDKYAKTWQRTERLDQLYTIGVQLCALVQRETTREHVLGLLWWTNEAGKTDPDVAVSAWSTAVASHIGGSSVAKCCLEFSKKYPGFLEMAKKLQGIGV